MKNALARKFPEEGILVCVCRKNSSGVSVFS